MGSFQTFAVVFFTAIKFMAIKFDAYEIPRHGGCSSSAVIEIGDFHNPSKERTKPLTSFHLPPSAKVQ